MMMLENELHILENLLSSHSEEGGLLHDQQTESDTSSQCLRYLRLSDPRTEKARLQESAGAQLPESSSWVFKTSQFKQWYADKDVCILRIKGSPGSGKTILLYHMIDRLTSFEEVGVCAFFFCRDVDKSLSSAHAVLRGMIFMLVEQLPSLLSHVLDKYNHQEIEPLDRFGSWNTLLDIFFNILLDPNVKIAYLIVDALDECNTDLPKLLDLIQMTSKLFRVKWIVSSRDWYNLTEILERTGQNRFLDIDLDAKNTTRNESLTAYIHHKTRTFAKLTGCDLETQKRMLDRICSSADGNYLWVNSMFRELESSHPRDAMNILESVPEDLFSAYSEMMVRIEASDYADRCKLLLITMTVVYPPPTLQHLVLLFDGSNKMSTEVWTEHELKETIAQSSGFLTICNKTLTFSHQSKRTFCIHYYLSQQISGDLFEVSYLSLFVQSIKVLSGTLRHNLYNAQTPGTTGARIKTPDPDPLSAIAYSCLYWVDHFISLRSDLRSQDDVNLLVAKFLTYHGLHWVEALSLLGRLSDGIDAMEKLENALVSNFGFFDGFIDS
ncbi:unnamed protein product [Penicillium salamii]|nr:unnamed protein product [Penicillium salamii]